MSAGSRRELLRGALAAALTALVACAPKTAPAQAPTEPAPRPSPDSAPPAPAPACEDPAPEAPSAGERLWIDTRLPAAFAAGHHPGALNLQQGWDQLEQRVRSYVPDRRTPLTLRGRTPTETRDAIRLLRTMGYRDLAAAPADAPEPEALPLETAAELQARLAGPSPPLVLDVRTPREWRTGTIPGARQVDEDAAAKLLEELEKPADYAVICEGGYRSSQLASWMHRHGFPHVTNVIDGMAAWRDNH